MLKFINIDTEVKDTDYIDAFIGSDNRELPDSFVEKI